MLSWEDFETMLAAGSRVSEFLPDAARAALGEQEEEEEDMVVEVQGQGSDGDSNSNENNKNCRKKNSGYIDCDPVFKGEVAMFWISVFFFLVASPAESVLRIRWMSESERES